MPNRSEIPENKPSNKEPAEGSRETVLGSEEGSGGANRPPSEQQENQRRIPRRGEHKEGGHA